LVKLFISFVFIFIIIVSDKENRERCVTSNKNKFFLETNQAIKFLRNIAFSLAALGQTSMKKVPLEGHRRYLRRFENGKYAANEFKVHKNIYLYYNASPSYWTRCKNRDVPLLEKESLRRCPDALIPPMSWLTGHGATDGASNVHTALWLGPFGKAGRQVR